MRKLLTLLLLLTPFGVGLLATVWFFSPDLIPTNTTSEGGLVVPQVLAPQSMHRQDRRWQVVTIIREPCNDACQERLWLMRQAYWALGKYAGRGSDAILSIDSANTGELTDTLSDIPIRALSSEQLASLLNQHPQLPSPAHLETWLIDPLGYIVLRYDPEATGNKVLRDWRKLVRMSQIG